MNHKTLDVSFEIKAVSDDGLFSGYGSVFGNVDSGGDIVHRGAFAKSIQEWEGRKRMPPVLWNHDRNEPIGVYTAIREDEKGLYVEGRLLVNDVQRAREIHALMKLAPWTECRSATACAVLIGTNRPASATSRSCACSRSASSHSP